MPRIDLKSPEFQAKREELMTRGREYWRLFAHWMLTPLRVARVLCAALGAIVFLVVFLVWFQIMGFLSRLPDLEKMNEKDLRVLAQRRIVERLENKRIRHRWVEIGDVSRGLLYSVVASEDATFFEHDGINLEAIVDSLAENLKKREAAYGASTISQQVVKNLFLNNEKTIYRKVREFLIVRDMERRFTKNQILEIYLNIAEFGPDIFGVEAATRHFFHKKPVEANAAEGAFVSLMLPSPRRNYFSIYMNKNLTKVKKKRIERVLRDMLYEEFITEDQYRQYVKLNYFPATASRMPARSRESRE